MCYCDPVCFKFSLIFPPDMAVAPPPVASLLAGDAVGVRPTAMRPGAGAIVPAPGYK